MCQRIQENLRDILDRHRVPPLPDKTLAVLERIRRAGDEQLPRQR